MKEIAKKNPRIFVEKYYGPGWEELEEKWNVVGEEEIKRWEKE